MTVLFAFAEPTTNRELTRQELGIASREVLQQSEMKYEYSVIVFGRHFQVLLLLNRGDRALKPK